MTTGVYIQVPFCQTKCTYCNFHTGVFASSLYAPYANAVCHEIEMRSQDRARVAAMGTVDSLYVGGGTPSLLAPVDLGRIMATLHERLDCEIVEATLEADPETVSNSKAEAWLAAGFNRISLGAQSFNDAELAAAGRMHRRADILSAVSALRAAGFGNISLDLIAGLAHQTESSWEDSLESLLALAPQHISIYMLEVDEGSRLGREAIAGGQKYGAANLPSDDETASFYDQARERLAAAGYEHYEISNWARPGYRSRHNLRYWRRELYLGIGAGAHSFNGRHRWANAHDPAAYVRAIECGTLPVEQEEEVTPRMAFEEELFLGLRQLEGIDLGRIERQYGVPLRGQVEDLRARGLVMCEGERVRLVPDRLAVSNEAFVELLEAVEA